MAGGYDSRRQQQRRQPLAERVARSRASTTDEPAPRPCWLLADQQVAGYVVGWEHTGDGWVALVVCRVPGHAVRPREPHPGAAGES